jgi:hypothetical protein
LAFLDPKQSINQLVVTIAKEEFLALTPAAWI